MIHSKYCLTNKTNYNSNLSLKENMQYWCLFQLYILEAKNNIENPIFSKNTKINSSKKLLRARISKITWNLFSIRKPDPMMVKFLIKCKKITISLNPVVFILVLLSLKNYKLLYTKGKNF